MRPPVNDPLPRTTPSVALAYCAANWLIPGSGYLLWGNFARGITLLILINLLFLIGVAYGGHVVMPAWYYKAPEFNIVAILTYLVEAFHGGGWLALQYLHSISETNPDAAFNSINMGQSAYSDLGVFHLIVAGGLNYASTVRLYDLCSGNTDLTVSNTVKDDFSESAGEEEEKTA